MSDMHVLDGRGDGTYPVAMHFPVPSGNNAVGVPWSTTVVESAGFEEDGITPIVRKSVLRTISQSEIDSIAAGTVFERVVVVRAESGGTTNAQLRASLREFYAGEKVTATALLETQLKYFGHTEDQA